MAYIFISKCAEHTGHLTVCLPFFLGRQRWLLQYGHLLYTFVLWYLILFICLRKNCDSLPRTLTYTAFSRERAAAFFDRLRSRARVTSASSI